MQLGEHALGAFDEVASTQAVHVDQFEWEAVD
jgi:hypothetical protein